MPNIGKTTDVYCKSFSIILAGEYDRYGVMSVPLGWLILLVSIFHFLDKSYGEYIPPIPTIEPLLPLGFRVSIPHDDGISWVGFVVKHNYYSNYSNSLEAGTTFSEMIYKPKNGRWVYENHSVQLKAGDLLYLGEIVVYNNVVYTTVGVRDMHKYNMTVMSPVYTPDDTDKCKSFSVTKIYTRDQKTQQLKPNRVCAGKTIFFELFDILDTNHWKVIERFSTAPNFEFVVYKNDQENVFVQDDILYIKPALVKEKYSESFVQDGTLELNKCTEQVGSRDCTRTANGWNVLPPVISGGLNTKPFFNFMYGRIQVRAKLPRGDWIYPLITLESYDSSPNATVFSSIVVAHSFGNPTLLTTDRKEIGGNLLRAGGHVTTVHETELQDNLMNLPSKTSDSLWSDDYHVYELEWGRESFILKVDGEQYGEQRVVALYDTPVYINVGLGVGGRTLFPDGSGSGNYLKPWKNKGVKAVLDFDGSVDKWQSSWRKEDILLEVDYIKVDAL